MRQGQPQIEIMPPVTRDRGTRNPRRQLGGISDAIGSAENYALNMGSLGAAGLLFMGPIGAVLGAGMGYLISPQLANIDQMVAGGQGQGNQASGESMFSGTNGAILLLGGILAVAFYTQAASGARRK